MERMLPPPSVKPAIPASAGGGAIRTTITVLVALMLLGGAWVRFNDQIADAVPALAGPAASVADRLADAGRIKALVELGLLADGATQAAVASMSLPAGDAKMLGDALARRRVRLVRMPLVDLGQDATAAADQGRLVTVSAGGYTRTVRLGRVPVVLTLPIGPMASVSFQTADAGNVAIGAISLAGLIRLPDFSAGQTMSLGIIAQ